MGAFLLLVVFEKAIDIRPWTVGGLQRRSEIWFGLIVAKKDLVSIYTSLFGRYAHKPITRDSASTSPGLPEKLVFDLARFVSQIEIGKAEE